MKTVIEICNSGLNFLKHLGAKMHFTEKKLKNARDKQALKKGSETCFGKQFLLSPPTNAVGC